MKKSFAILCSFAFLLLLTPSVIKAQSLVIPNVYVKDIKLESSTLVPGQVVKGTFNTLSDTTSVASDIYFKISLVGGYQKNTLASKWYDTTTLTSPFEIKAGETKPVAFSYTIPQVKAGTGYGIQIQAMTHAGIPLGWSDAYVKVSAGDAKTQLLDILSAKLTVGKDSFALQEGPTVPEGKSVIFDITIKNATSQSVTLTPTIDLYNHVVLGTPLSTTKAISTTIATGSQKEFLIPLPTNNNQPLVYVSHVSFLDANSVSRVTPLDVRYIVAGDIATIQTLSTDKKSFNKGDAVSVTLGFSGTPFDITTGKNQATAIYNTTVNLLNSQNIIIGTASAVIDYNATGTKTLAIKTTDKANGYTVDVNVTKGAKVITHYSTEIGTETNPIAIPAATDMNWYGLIYGIIIGLIIIAIILLTKRNKSAGTALLLLLVLSGLTYTVLNYGSIQNARAQVANDRVEVGIFQSPYSLYSPNDYAYTFLEWDPTHTTNNRVKLKGAGTLTISPSSPVVGSSVNSKSSIDFSGSITYVACNNSVSNTWIRARWYDNSNQLVKQIDWTKASSQPAGSCPEVIPPATASQYCEVNPQFSVQIATPESAGTYKLLTEAKTIWDTNATFVYPNPIDTGIPDPAFLPYQTSWVQYGQTITVVDGTTPTDPLAGLSCAATPSPIYSGNPVTWSVTGTSPSFTYSYVWEDSTGFTSSGGVPSISKSYQYDSLVPSKNKINATSTISSGGHSVVLTCPTIDVKDAVVFKSVASSCEPHDVDNHVISSAKVGQSVTWVALDNTLPTPKEVDANWQGDEVAGTPISKTLDIRYSTIGKKTMQITASDGNALICYPDSVKKNVLQIYSDTSFQPH